MKASLVLLTLLCLTPATAGTPPTGDPYRVERSTIDSGGGISTGDAYRLEGTIGQADAGPPLVGGAYGLTGGFWTRTVARDEILFSDGFENEVPQ